VSVGDLTPVRLRCGYKDAPLAVEPDRVRFSWELSGQGRGRRQEGYELVVGEGSLQEVQEVHDGGPERDGAPREWSTGRVDSSSSADVAYRGPALAPGSAYVWKVRAWDESGRPGPWSEPASFETALGGREAWTADWVRLGPGPQALDAPSGDGLADPVLLAMGPAPYFRREFKVSGRAVRARLYITALGVYEVSLNGHQVSRNVLAPGWTDYSKRILYQTYDVTDLLLPGPNVLGAIVGDGWAVSFYGFDGKRRGAHYARAPELLAQLVVQFGDGTDLRVGTDELWRGSTGEIIYSDLLMGERRDRAREPLGWDCPGFDATTWSAVLCRAPGPELLFADPGPAVLVTEEVPARDMSVRRDGSLIVDFGQNLAGWVRARTQSAPGTVVQVRHGEMLDQDGGLYVDNLRTARQTDCYVATGGLEELAPRFTFHGFRYAEVTGLGEGSVSSDFTACVVHSDTARTGQFECSADAVQQLYLNIDWGQRANFISVPTDCPQRDERLGWLGDAQIFAATAAYNRDVASFFSKWYDDVVDAQLPSGAFTDFAPRIGHDWPGAPAWADAGVIVPWTMYRMYGDKGILERNFPAMVAWMDFLEANNPGYLRTAALGNNYGDWLAPAGDETPRELLATAYWAYDAALMARIAEAIGQPEKMSEYIELAAAVRQAFREAYLGEDGQVLSGTQTAYVVALHMDLLPAPLRSAAAARLVRAIADQDWHLTTGFIGVGYLLPVLSQNGYAQVAYRLLEQRSFPSWLYALDQGATTIWERWDGWTEERGFQSPRMNSFNHYSLGSVGEWLYRFVLGIELGPEGAGFDDIVLRPYPGGSLSWARGGFRSVRGRIQSSWALEGDRLRVEVTVPPNVRATVHVPSSRPQEVSGPDGLPPGRVAAYPGALGQQEAVFDIGSGTYTFTGAAPRLRAVGEVIAGLR